MGAVDGADVGPVDRPARTARDVARGDDPCVAADEQGGRIDGDAGGGEFGDGEQQPAHPGLTGDIGGDHPVRPRPEDLRDQLGQHAAGARLDERPHTGGVHRLDLLDEPHRRGHLTGERRPDLRRCARIRRRGGVGPDGPVRGLDRDVGEQSGQGVRGGGHHRAVEGAGHRNAPGRQTGLRERLDRPGQCRGRPGDGDLTRRVVVGDHHGALGPVGAQVGENRPDLLDGSGHGGHRAGVVARGGQDRAGPRLAEPDQVSPVEHAGGDQGDEFAVGVATDMIGSDTQAREQVVHGQAGQAQGGLRGPGVGDRRDLGVSSGAGEGRRREHRVDPLGGEVEDLTQPRERHEQVGEHPRPLAALTGEQHRGRPRTNTIAGVSVVGADEPTGLRVRGERAGRLDRARQGSQVVDDEGDLDRPAAGAGRAGEVTQPQRMAGRGAGGDELCESVQGPAGGRPVGTADHEQFRGPLVEAVAGFRSAVVGREHDVEVRAAEPERGHAGVTVRGRRHPGLGRLVEVERAGVGLPVGVGGVDVQRRRTHPGLQRLRHLDQPGQAGGALGVPDLRLHRAHRARTGLGAVVDEHLGEGGEFGAVTDHGAGGVRLEQTDVTRGDPGPRVGPFQRADLALLTRGGQAQRPPVGRAGHRADHGVDAVAVALGVGEPFEHHDRGALTEAGAVGPGVETAAPPVRRQRVHRGEQQEVMGAGVGVHTPAQHQVGGTGDQFLAAGVQGGQRRRAGRVDGEVHPAEVEPVRDPSGDDVREHTGEGVLVQLGQERLELRRQGTEQSRPQGTHAVGGGQVGTGLGPEHHRRARPVERTAFTGALLGRVVSGAAQRPRGDLERQQLAGLDTAQRPRRDAVGQRVERDARQETTPLRRGVPAGFLGHRVGTVVDPRVPPVVRHLADGVDTGHDVRPVGVEIGGVREDRRHADDGDVQRSCVAVPDRHRRGRPGVAGRPGGQAQIGGAGRQRLAGTAGDLLVQVGDRRAGRAQRRHLTDHEHSLPDLQRGVDLDEPVTVAAQALAGHPQPAQVQRLQLLPHLLAGRAGGQQLPAAVEEGAHEVGLDAPGGMPG